MRELVTAKFHQQSSAPPVVRVRFQGYAPITIDKHPEIGVWAPGYYRELPVELAETLMWLSRVPEGEEPDFIDTTGQPDIDPWVNTRKVRVEAEIAARGEALV